MDCERSARRVLIGAALAFASLSAAAQGPALLAARWLPPDRQSHALAFAPTECLAVPSDPELARRVAIGRAAFRTPLLLGGQAARAGLSCNSCHRNGRGNPDFQFPGLSGVPGTADVTSALMSSKRGDGIANPVAIPDLSGSPTQLKVSRAEGERALEHFIGGLIEAEFDGHKPSALTLASVSDYVRALSQQHCPEATEQQIQLADYLSDAGAAMQAALHAQAADDPVATRLMLASARTALGLIDERYQSAGTSRAGLRAADRELAALQAAVDAGRADVSTRITAWIATMSRWTKALEIEASGSLFNAALLTAPSE